MLSTQNEKLAGIRADLLALQLRGPDRPTLNALRMAIDEIVPDMSPSATIWVALMLTDKAYLIGSKDSEFSAELHCLAVALAGTRDTT